MWTELPKRLKEKANLPSDCDTESELVCLPTAVQRGITGIVRRPSIIQPLHSGNRWNPLCGKQN